MAAIDLVERGHEALRYKEEIVDHLRRLAQATQ
jgi:hypothetical protein